MLYVLFSQKTYQPITESQSIPMFGYCQPTSGYGKGGWMQADLDRLHDAVYGALRLIEDADLVGAELSRAVELAEQLQREISRLLDEPG